MEWDYQTSFWVWNQIFTLLTGKSWDKPGFLRPIYAVLASVADIINLVILQFEHLFPHVVPWHGRCLIFGASALCVLGESAM